MKTTCYHRLSFVEREEISRGLAAGRSFRSIARQLRRSPSTIAREAGGHTQTHEYRAVVRQRQAVIRAGSRRRGRCKISLTPLLRSFIHRHVRKGWSPDQIANALKKRYPHNMAMHSAPETIYAYIYVLPRGELKRSLIAGLRQERKHRRPHQDTHNPETRGKLSDMLSIEERPAAVADRTVPGHWEGDLILGKWKRSALGTLVERTTRLTLLVRLAAKDATAVRHAYAAKLKRLPAALRQTLTYDQGKELSEHQQLTMETGTQVYFAHPGSPWERGTNENTNGLIRQYFPKGTDFTTVTAREIRRVQDLLNNRPRKALHYLTPLEVFNQLLR
ncbi:MAG: IS30 family transposase [Patescibacteria group bacterium]